MDNRGVLELLIKAHFRAALDNNNVSSAMVKQMAAVGEPFEKAVAAALLSLGGPIHGPAADARYVIFDATDGEIQDRLRLGKKIPGFGNQFYTDKVDPAFEDFYVHIENNCPVIYTRLLHVAALILEAKGKFLYPNAASATSITAELLDVIPGTEIQLVMMGRLPAWAQQWEEVRNGTKN